MIIDNTFAGASTDTDGLVLDPGPPPRRKSMVTCNSTWALWIVLVVVAFSGSYFGYNVVHTKYTRAKNPHHELYQDLNIPYGPQDVIRPLVDANQTFDIVATVWLRTDPEPGAEVKNGAPDDDPSALVEKAIFTDTIFRGLRLQDENLKATIKFRLPTEVFKKRELYPYDLRGSFVLIPSTPSPLDHVLNYSSWIPTFIEYPPSRSWPDGYTPSLAEKVVDAYGTFTPLLSFHNVKSRCGSSPSSSVHATTSVFPNPGGDEVVEGDEEDSISDPSLHHVVPSALKHRFSKKGQPPLESHPYIVTRSFLRVVHMTKLYNLAAYNESRERLKMSACGEAMKLRALRTGKPDWRLCTRSFLTNGHHEVKIMVGEKAEETGKGFTEWVYAPYLSVSESAAGPLDLVPVPVNREDCPSKDSSGNENVPDEDFIDVTWNVAFAGRTPEKLRFADVLSISEHGYNMTAPKGDHLVLHSGVEFIEGMAGHQIRENFHPRRTGLLIGAGSFLVILGKILALHYWYSRVSTVGISLTGNALIALASMLDYLLDAIIEITEASRAFTTNPFIWALSRYTISQILSFSTLKAITRAEFRLSKGWVPTLRFAPASHAERASQRLESRTSWGFKVPVFVILACLFYFCNAQDIYIVNPTEGTFIPRTRVIEGIITLNTATVSPAIILGRILQLVMNFRSRKFSGTYKTGAILGCLGSLLKVAGVAPSIVGQPLLSAGITVYTVCELAVITAMAFQALQYPAVSPIDEDEDPTSR